MLSLRALRRSTWMAVFAVLLNAFGPLASHALESTRAGNWLEICSGDGIQRVRVADDQVTKNGTSETDRSGAHCLYCVPHGVALGLAPPSPLPVPIIAGADANGASVDSISLPQSHWAANQARAPPSSH